MRIALLLVLMMLAAASTPLRANAPAACTAATATDTTIEAIQTDYAAWRGKCARVRGIAVGRRIFADRMALLEPHGDLDEDPRHSLFLHGVRVTWRNPMRIEAAGVVGSCKEDSAEVLARDETMVVPPFCDTALQTYLGEPVIKILSSGPIPRLTEAEVPADRRELVAVGPEVWDYARHVAAARDMIGAVAEGDLARFQFLDLPESPDKDSEQLRMLRGESRSLFERHSASRPLFAALHRAGPDRIRVFMDRERLASLRIHGDREEIVLLSCWCKTASCAGRWPVIRFDTGNVPERPYLCVSTNNYTVYQGGTFIQARLEIMPGGFAEPRWK